MNSEEIETFLAVVQAGSMSQAANDLFVSQGTVSARIMNLESKLQIKLFFRQQGIRKLALTTDGQRFFQISQQLQTLNEEAEQIKAHPQFQELRVVASDSITTFLLEAFYTIFMQRHPDVFLVCQTEHSTEAHTLIEAQDSDLGFCFSLHSFANVVATPIYQEPLTLVYHRESRFANSLNLIDLLDTHEVLSYMSKSVSIWHQRVFPNQTRNKIVLGTARSMIDFMTDVDDWSVQPLSVAKAFVKQVPQLTYSAAPQFAPKRVAYVLEHRHPRTNVKPWINIFLTELHDYMSEQGIETFA